jgi:hypothetical protein
MKQKLIKNWRQVYIVVLAALAIEIILFFLITQRFA